MSTVLVTGGTGTLGSALVPRLGRAGHEVRVLSRRPGPGVHQGDLATGAGVSQAVRGVDVVVHAASDARRLGRNDVAFTSNLLAAMGGQGHLLYVSIVGVDAIPYGYYRRKLACEELLGASGVAHTILRATQFHQLIAMAMRAVERLPLAPLPVRFRAQPVAADEVADAIVALLEAPMPVGTGCRRTGGSRTGSAGQHLAGPPRTATPGGAGADTGPGRGRFPRRPQHLS